MTLRSRLSATGLVLSLPLTAAATSAQEPRSALTPEMVVDLEQVTAVSLSPDARSVAYTLEVPREIDDEPGDSYSELWVADLETGATRRFAGHREEISSPAWSPDGESITFRVKREEVQKGVQIHAIPAAGGEARPMTRIAGDVSSYRWSPDGKHIAFAAKDHDSEPVESRKKAGEDWVVWSESSKHRHLWLHDVESGESRRLFETDLDAREIHWSPDGATLYFQATTAGRIDDEYMFTRIYRVPAAGATEPEIVTPTEGKLGHMAVSPDGRHLAFLGATSLNDPIAQSLFVVPVAGGDSRNLSEGYLGTGVNLAWIGNDGIALLAIEGERHALYDVAFDSGAMSPRDLGGLVVRQFDHDAESGLLALAAETREHPADLYLLAPGTSGPRRIGHHNEALGGVRLAHQEVVEWRGAGGWTIRGVLTYPLDYREGERVPLVLQVHGGPEGVSLDGWTTRAGYPVQLLAARGYAVLQPNYRGSGGRGVAFSKGDHDDLGGAEFEDILAGIDELAARGLIDPRRVGTGGWSYGGYLSAWAATRHSERFRAAVVAAGLTNWISFAGSTDIPYEMSLVHWNSWWFDQPELHWQRSPLAHLDKASTPTLVVTGAEDERVHPEQAMELHTALRIKQVPTEMVFYPREPHGLDERAHRLDFIDRTLSWFDRYLSEPEVEAIDQPKN